MHVAAKVFAQLSDPVCAQDRERLSDPVCGDYANNLNHPNTLGSCGLSMAEAAPSLLSAATTAAAPATGPPMAAAATDTPTSMPMQWLFTRGLSTKNTSTQNLYSVHCSMLATRTDPSAADIKELTVRVRTRARNLMTDRWDAAVSTKLVADPLVNGIMLDNMNASAARSTANILSALVNYLQVCTADEATAASKQVFHLIDVATTGMAASVAESALLQCHVQLDRTIDFTPPLTDAEQDKKDKAKTAATKNTKAKNGCATSAFIKNMIYNRKRNYLARLEAATKLNGNVNGSVHVKMSGGGRLGLPPRIQRQNGKKLLMPTASVGTAAEPIRVASGSDSEGEATSKRVGAPGASIKDAGNSALSGAVAAPLAVVPSVIGATTLASARSEVCETLPLHLAPLPPNWQLTITIMPPCPTSPPRAPPPLQVGARDRHPAHHRPDRDGPRQQHERALPAAAGRSHHLSAQRP